MYPNIPEDIICDILLRLPAKTLARFRFVSKSWQNLISSSYFCYTHLNRSLQDENNSKVICVLGKSPSWDDDFARIEHVDPPLPLDFHKCHFTRLNPDGCGVMSIIASCNGIVCLELCERVIGLLNPTTREYKELPQVKKEIFPFITPKPYRIFRSFGFGYDTITHDYVVVRITCSQFYDKHNGKSEVHVYSLIKNSWEKLRAIPYVVHYDYYTYCSKPGVFASSALHWLVAPCENSKNKPEMVIAFDIPNKRFSEIPLPAAWQHAHRVEIFKLNGNLCCGLYNANVVDLYQYSTGDYLVNSSWSVMFRIEFRQIRCTPIHIINQGDAVLYSSNCGSYNDCGLYLYDLVDKTDTHVKISGSLGVYGATTFVESLVPLIFESKPGQNNERTTGVSEDCGNDTNRFKYVVLIDKKKRKK